MVEVLGDDSSWSAMERKIGEYHAFGVDTVWVVDARVLAVRVYPRDAQPVTRQATEDLTIPALPGFRCVVKEPFE